MVAPDPVVTVPLKTGETANAPGFPLGKCSAHGKQMWYGPKSDSDHQVSGWFNKKSDGTKGAEGLFTWQKRMAYRGWKITPDGLWGDETRRVALAFQKKRDYHKMVLLDKKLGRPHGLPQLRCE